MPQRELLERSLFWERERLRLMEERYMEQGGEKLLLSILWTRRRIARLLRDIKATDTLPG